MVGQGIRRGLLAGLAVLVWTAGARAEDRALIIANGSYAEAPDVAGARRLADAAEALRRAGFTVTAARDRTASEMRGLMSGLLGQLAEGDRVVILLGGHVVRTGARSVLLGVEALAPDLAMLAEMGLDLAEVLDIAAAYPGAALVGIGTDGGRLTLGAGRMEPGIGPLDVPQGVAVVTGDATALARFAAQKLVQEGVSLAALGEGETGLTLSGYLPAQAAFRPVAAPPDSPADPPPAQNEPARAEEEAAWAKAREAGSIAGYEAYVAAFPQGRFATLARSELERLRNDPVVQAQAAETALGLSRDARRTVQRQLALLGHDPRGIDGLFGRGSRAAISAWQQAQGLRATGYLDREQLLRLEAQAARRAAELEAEAAARQAEQERQDRNFWSQTGAAGDEAGLRAYLRRFPDGLFADVATDRLAVIEEDRRAQAAGRDRAAWDTARAAQSVAAYRSYLAEFPQGAFAAEAEARIAELEAEAAGGPDRERAEAAEAALGLNALARRLIERRLEGLGYDPGEVDGAFDERARRAIRRFQAARELAATGYVDQPTMVALLAGGLVPFGE
jgi:peptidoglycan hydrolase-like protein with peptidoglycan-binding domain